MNFAQRALPLGSLLGRKARLFSGGRRKLFSELASSVDPSAKNIWIHAASLGEFEQAVPVLEMLRQEYPDHRVLVSFFSPSGFEHKKQHPLVDHITYLPLDTRANARRFLDLVSPQLVFFVKYDIWPNFLTALKERNIRTFLFSAVFREDQLYFKPYGQWMRRKLGIFEYIFVQDKASEVLLRRKGFTKVSLSGDTRFDRVYRQLSYNNKDKVLEKFLQDELCIVAGSTWPEDILLFRDFINSAPDGVKFVIAPHEVEKEKIRELQEKIKVPSILYSKAIPEPISQYPVLIVDNIGLLSRIYSYAAIAYVGGAAGKTGMHNILEPATFGIPVVIGRNFSEFPEAIALKERNGLFSVANAAALQRMLNQLIQDPRKRTASGKIAGTFIRENTGATSVIRKVLQKE